MFTDDSALESMDLSKWDTSNVTDMTGLFKNAKNLQTVIMSMDLSKVQHFNSMFENATGLNTIDFQNTKFADKATTAWMFSVRIHPRLNIQLSGAKNIPKDVFDTFKNAAKTQKVDKIDLSNASLSSEVTGSGLLSGLSDVKQIDVTNFDISHVTDMTNMFSGDTNLTKIKGLSTWNVGNVTSMKSMFDGDNNLQTIDGIGEWDVSNATDMTNMFSGDTALTNLDLSNWKPLKVTNMAAMFKGCSGLKSINTRSSVGDKILITFKTLVRCSLMIIIFKLLMALVNGM